MQYPWIIGVLGALAGASLAAPGPIPAPTSLHPEDWPSAAPQRIGDAASERRVDDLLATLTLEDKVGQMIQADIDSITPADLGQYRLGSILAGGNAAPGHRLRATPQAWLELVDGYARASVEGQAAVGRPAIPILFGIDAVHGHAKLKGATIFPHNVGLGAAHDPALIERIGAATAEEVAATGIDWTFAPTVAVVRDVRWGRSYESYSESPDLVARYAPAMVTGLQGRLDTPQFLAGGHTLSSPKHFLGDGGTLGGRDQGDTELGEAEFARVHGAGYAPAIAAGAMIVMASYNSWNGVKMHANHYLLTDVLKGRMGFQGFVVGDWNAQEQVPGCTKSDCPTAILAGIDMLMAPDGWRELYDNTLREVRAGLIPQGRIDDAVRRILRVKVAAHVLDEPRPAARPDAGRFERLGSAAHRALAREAVRESLVLLKNDHGLLPLDPHAHVLVAGPGADDIAMQSGGWTIDWQGDHNTNADFPGGTSIYAGIEAAVAGAGGSAELAVDGRYARRPGSAQRPDVAIVVYGEHPYAEFEGDRETLEYSPGDAADLKLLRRLKADGIPVVSVFLSGRPLWVNPELNASDAFVAAWLPGSEGAGIAEVLFKGGAAAGHDFTGRLSFSWPATGLPVTFAADDRVHGALFANGYGLDYAGTAGAAGRGAIARHYSEDPAVPAALRAPAGSLFYAGHVTAPWSLFVADGGAEVHVTTHAQQSPHGALRVELGPAGAAATWDGSRDARLRITGRALDLSTASQGAAGTLEVKVRVARRPAARVALGVEGAWVDVTSSLRAVGVGAWQTLRIPVACLAAGGANLSQVQAPLEIDTAGALSLTLGAARLTPAASGAAGRGAAGPGAAGPGVAACPPTVGPLVSVP